MKNEQLRSAAWMFAWCWFFTFAMMLAKQGGSSVGIVMLVFVRLIFGLCFALPILWHRRIHIHRPQQRVLYLLSALLGCVARFCTYYAYNKLPLALATAIGYTVPLMVALLSVVVLRKRITSMQWAALLVGYLGVWLMIQPGKVAWNCALGAAFVANALASVGNLLVKRISHTESPENQLLYRTLLSILLIAGFALWEWQPLPAAAWYRLAGIGGLGVISQYCRLQAISQGEPFIVSSVSYLKVLIAAPLGLLFFNEIPTYWLWIGSICIIAANAYLVAKPQAE